ncbi:MAG: hypothetical protein Q8K58_04575 [Acidimicrobiales bacterium]|nr:hypothetical protein [Acidimicrobiales bacterium]
MEETSTYGRRAARLLAFAVGGGVALTLALASSASADDVVVQEAEVVNAGAAVANSGGNVAVGNASENDAETNQDAVGAVAVNTAETSNHSDGTAVIETGDATATGNESATSVAQHADTGGDGGGADVVVQDAEVTNVGAAAANSGGNIAVGNVSDNDAETNQGAVGAVAVNVAATSNHSDGTAKIHTGDATATGNRSLTGIAQHADTGGGGGLDVVVQDADVLNAGLAFANSGGNIAVGNLSDNDAETNQGAFGLLAFNVAGTTNHSDGHASITTGNATATGNESVTGIVQSADTGCDDGLNVVLQSAGVVNVGLAFANSGFNVALGNLSSQSSVVNQGAFGLIAANLASSSNTSGGTAWIHTGAAWAAGNRSATFIGQHA